MGIVIMPITQYLKNVQFFANVDPKSIVAILSIISVAILSRFLAPDMTVEEIIKTGFALVGIATMTHWSKGQIVKVKKIIKKG